MTVLAPNPTRVLYCRARTAGPKIEPGDGQLLVGDAVTKLRTLPNSSVDCVITSPPYFLLRNYGHDDQIGLEATVHDWVDQLSAVMAEVARVLKPTGSVYLNLGDSFSRSTRYGAPAKSLLLGPERLLLALADAGWIVRNKIIWAKPNPMPASVRDRLTCSWEPIYFMVRSPDYFFDLDVAREPHKSRKPSSANVREGKYESANPIWAGPLAGKNDGLLRARTEGRAGHPLGKNPGDVWQHSTATFNGAHFAVYPERLIERPMKLSCPERVCRSCGRPWRREIRRDRRGDLGPDCACGGGWQPGVVLDPFMGSGTTAVVAEQLGRRWIGVELNPVYADLARQRIREERIKNGSGDEATSDRHHRGTEKHDERVPQSPGVDVPNGSSGLRDEPRPNLGHDVEVPRKTKQQHEEADQDNRPRQRCGRRREPPHRSTLLHPVQHAAEKRSVHRQDDGPEQPHQIDGGSFKIADETARPLPWRRIDAEYATDPSGTKAADQQNPEHEHAGERQGDHGHDPSLHETTDTERRINVNGGTNA